MMERRDLGAEERPRVPRRLLLVAAAADERRRRRQAAARVHASLFALAVERAAAAAFARRVEGRCWRASARLQNRRLLATSWLEEAR